MSVSATTLSGSGEVLLSVQLAFYTPLQVDSQAVRLICSSQPPWTCLYSPIRNSLLQTQSVTYVMSRARISMHYQTLKHACIHAVSYD